MLSLDGTQQTIAASDYKTVKWLFKVTLDGSGSPDYYWSTKACSYSGDTYTAKILGDSFRGVSMERSRSEFGMASPSSAEFVVSNPNNSLTASDFEDCVIEILQVLSDGSNEETFYHYLMVQKSAPEDIQQTLRFKVTDILTRYLKGDYPNEPLISYIFPNKDADYGNPQDGMCVPLVFGTAYIPLRAVFSSSDRRYLLGPVDSSGPTYTITEVRAPRDRGFTTYSSGSYDFDTQSSETGGDGNTYRCFQPLVFADPNDSSLAPLLPGLWLGNGNYLADMGCKFSRSDTVSMTNPANIISYVLQDFGIPSGFINVSAAASTFTSWGLTWNHGFYYRKSRTEFLADLLSMCHSTLDTSGGEILLRPLVNDSQATINTSNVKGQKTKTSFRYSTFIKDVDYDGGDIAFPASGEPIDQLQRISVDLGYDDAMRADEVFEIPLVNDSQDAQIIGALKYERQFGREASLSFDGGDSLTGLQPDDVVQINNANYGGTYNVLVDSIFVNKDCSLRISATRYRWTLHDFDDSAMTYGSFSPTTGSAVEAYNVLPGTIATPSGGVFLTTDSDLDDIPDGDTYARVLAASLSAGAVLLSQAAGDLDDIANGTYAKVLASSISAGLVLLSAASGDLDDITNGSTYGKVLLADLSGGHILLANTVGDIDDVDDGSTYAKVLATDISAGHILLSEASGDLDDIADGTYGKVLSADISAGHILMTAVSGDLDDIADGTYGKVLATDISAGHILLSEVSGDLDDVDDGTTYSKILATDVSAGHILLSEASGDLDDIGDGSTYAKVLATDISSGHILLSETSGDLDDIANGTSYGKVAVTDISSGHIVLSTCTGDLDDITNGTTYEKVRGTVIDSGYIYLMRRSADQNERLEIGSSTIDFYTNGTLKTSYTASGIEVHNGTFTIDTSDSGQFSVVGSGGQSISMDGSGNIALVGAVTFQSASGYANISDKPTSLSGINSTEGTKLTGIADGADVGAPNLVINGDFSADPANSTYAVTGWDYGVSGITDGSGSEYMRTWPWSATYKGPFDVEEGFGYFCRCSGSTDYGKIYSSAYIPIERDKRYTIGFWAKAYLSSNTNTYLRIWLYDGAKAACSPTYLDILSMHDIATSWEYHEGTIYAYTETGETYYFPSNCCYIKIEIYPVYHPSADTGCWVTNVRCNRGLSASDHVRNWSSPSDITKIDGGTIYLGTGAVIGQTASKHIAISSTEIEFNNGVTTLGSLDADGYHSGIQPGFYGHVGSGNTSITGDGTVATLTFTEDYDQGSNFSSNTFTAPQDGVYLVVFYCRLYGLNPSTQTANAYITAGGNTYQAPIAQEYMTGTVTVANGTLACCAILTATQTIQAKCSSGGGSAGSVSCSTYSHMSITRIA